MEFKFELLEIIEGDFYTEQIRQFPLEWKSGKRKNEASWGNRTVDC